ncbi:MAG: GNAT family N-acetyltransferase [Anaerolineales bacterium]|nr:GNAT family N-acetyltransferase [Anaerolineales bacterium]
MPIEPIQTERLLLRNLIPDDAPAMYAIRTHPSTLRFQPWHPANVNAVAAFIEEQRERSLALSGWLQLAIVLRESDAFIGDCGLHRQTDPAQVEIGITLAPGKRRKGFALEALQAVLGYLFERCDVHRVFGVADARNDASIALMRRAGMRPEARMRQSYRFRDEWTDEVVYAFLKEEWPG